MKKLLTAWRRTSIGIMLLCWAVLAEAPGMAWAQPAELYKLKPGDVISISVLEDPLLDRETLVAPDGQIAMPLAGTIPAAGLTPQQLQQTIRKRLRRRFVEPPTVTVSLVSVAETAATVEEQDPPLEIYVLGEVAQPGRFEYAADTSLTILQALTLAGGPGPFAATRRIQVREIIEDTERLRLFDYEAVQEGVLTSGTDLSALEDGAIIVVPERGLFE